MNDKTLQEAEYFRQQVTVDIEIAVYEKTGLQLTDKQGEAAADAAIATMFERLRTPSEVAVFMGVEQWCQQPDDPDADVIGIWQAMLAAFQQENSDA